MVNNPKKVSNVKGIVNQLLAESVSIVPSTSSIMVDHESPIDVIASQVASAVRSEGEALVIYEALLSLVRSYSAEINEGSGEGSAEFIIEQIVEIIADEKNHIDRLNLSLQLLDKIAPVVDEDQLQSEYQSVITRVDTNRITETIGHLPKLNLLEASMSGYEKLILEEEPVTISIDSDKLLRVMDREGYNDMSLYKFILDTYGLEKGKDFTVNSDDESFTFIEMTPKSLKLASDVGINENFIIDKYRSLLNENVDYNQLVNLVDEYSIKLSNALEQARLISDSGTSEVTNYIKRYTIPDLEKLFSLVSYNGSLPQIQKLVNKIRDEDILDSPDDILGGLSYPDYSDGPDDEDEE